MESVFAYYSDSLLLSLYCKVWCRIFMMCSFEYKRSVTPMASCLLRFHVSGFSSLSVTILIEAPYLCRFTGLSLLFVWVGVRLSVDLSWHVSRVSVSALVTFILFSLFASVKEVLMSWVVPVLFRFEMILFLCSMALCFCLCLYCTRAATTSIWLKLFLSPSVIVISVSAVSCRSDCLVADISFALCVEVIGFA